MSFKEYLDMAVSSYFHLGSSFGFLRTRHHVIIVHFISECQDRDCSSDYMNKPYSIGIMVCQLSTTHIRFTVWNTDK